MAACRSRVGLVVLGIALLVSGSLASACSEPKELTCRITSHSPKLGQPIFPPDQLPPEARANPESAVWDIGDGYSNPPGGKCDPGDESKWVPAGP